MPTAELAAASANAVVASYITVLHAQVKSQANSSISALDKEIATIKAQFERPPSPSTGKSGSGGSGSSTEKSTTTTTTVVKPPKTTTTRAPRATTTRPPRRDDDATAPHHHDEGIVHHDDLNDSVLPRIAPIAPCNAADLLPRHGDDDHGCRSHDHDGRRSDDHDCSGVDHHHYRAQFRVEHLGRHRRRTGAPGGHPHQPHPVSLPGAGGRTDRPGLSAHGVSGHDPLGDLERELSPQLPHRRADRVAHRCDRRLRHRRPPAPVRARRRSPSSSTTFPSWPPSRPSARMPGCLPVSRS